MVAWIAHLTKHKENIAFIQANLKISFSTFLNDIERTELEIKSQVLVAQPYFIWDYRSNYRNVVRLFAMAKCNAIIVPENIASRLFQNNTKKTIHCFHDEIIVFENPGNVFSETLKSRQTAGILIATSGTGKNPKDMVMDFGMLLRKYVKLKSSYISTLIFSLEHISGLETLLSIITPGGCIVLEEDRTPYKLAAVTEKYHANLLACTPTFLIQLYLQNLLNEKYFDSVKIINCGGEALTPLWLQKFTACIPWIEIRQAFGTTESTNIRTVTSTADKTKFKPGILHEDYEINNQILYLKNKKYILGQWHENKLLDDEWIATSDMVESDQEGFLSIIGRTENMISVGGKKVNPAEVETVIGKLPFVTQVSVYGEKNLLLGQIVVAAVHCSGEPTENIKSQIMAYCRAYLEEYKLPMKIHFKNDIPFTLRFKG